VSQTTAKVVSPSVPSTSAGEDWSRPLSVMRPLRIEFGAGRAAYVGEWAAEHNLKRALVVSDAFNANRVDRLALPGTVEVFSAVKPEPDLPNLMLLVEAARAFQPDVIVGFGGGSSMDLAKLAGVMINDTRPFEQLVGAGRALGRASRLIQVPTTAGTGSEAGTRALVTDPVTKSKLAVESKHMIANMAVIDPELTMTVPGAITAATGIDALAHCVEGYTSKRSHPIIDMYAREGISLVGKYLAHTIKHGDDANARAALALASLYGGICLGPVNTTAGHAISYPLGTRYGIAHGLANAVIFPHTLSFNASAAPEKTADIALRLGLDQSDLLASAYKFCADMGVEMRLSALGVPKADLPSMADEAFAIRRLLDYNPRPISSEEILGIYQAAY
jgi:alcohol dehydrogenase class IV